MKPINKIINKEALRYKNEFVRHKIVDAVGDLALLGARIIGRYTGICSDHQLNNALIEKLMANDHTWEYSTVRNAQKYWNDLMQHPYHETITKPKRYNKFAC